MPNGSPGAVIASPGPPGPRRVTAGACVGGDRPAVMGWTAAWHAMDDGVRLHVASGGPPGGPRILLLHGFPDCGSGWRGQLEPLAAAGFRVIVPDLRGYGASDAPGGVDAYRLARLVADVVALADGVALPDGGPIHLVGHDWGGIVAWAVAARHPERVARLTILNAPHLDGVPGTLRRHPAQLFRSAYIGFFQLDGPAERLLGARDCALLRRMLRATALPGSFTAADVAALVAQWRRPGRLAAMLGYYRALVRRRHAALGRIRVPVQILWGMADPALGFALATASLALCDDGRLIPFPGASHWLQRDRTEAVNAALIAFHEAAARP